MYQHKAGYGPGEQFATHGRRRYRLTTKFSNPSMANPDPALWITHYYQAEPADRVPSNIIPMGDIRAQALIQTRMYLQTQGQIVQKEFMLHDRQNWPQIQFPRNQVRQAQYPIGTTRTPQVMAYPPHQMGAGNLGPPAKRARTQANPTQGPPTMGAIPPVDSQDDEEDTSRGDLFDHMTPREVSMSRYKQNHEWMEEIMSSPYPIGQITPVDLGLGLRGELSNLTDGIFQAPTGTEQASNGYSGRLDPVKAEEFRKRATEHVTETNAEMERMKLKHAKRMARFKRNALIAQAELELRTAVHDPADVGPEYWRLEGRTDDKVDDDRKQVAKIHERVDEIVAQVEASLGRHAIAVEELKRIQDGGLEESQPVPSPPVSRQPSRSGSQQSGVLIGDGDLDMGGSAAGLLDQFHTGFSSGSTPGGSFPTPQPHLQANSSTGTPRLDPSPQPSNHNEAQGPVEPTEAEKTAEDIDMGDATSKDGQGTGDWVVVPEGGVSPSDNVAQPRTTFPETEAADPPPTTSELAVDLDRGDSAADLDMELGDNFNTDANDFGSLEDLDTAGEALAGYDNSDMGEHGGDLGGDLDLGMDMGLDDSAFGDAFHGVEPRDGDGDGDGM
jgi:hypothetical protein